MEKLGPLTRILLATGAALSLAACGGSGEAPRPTSTPQRAPQVPAYSVGPDCVTIGRGPTQTPIPTAEAGKVPTIIVSPAATPKLSEPLPACTPTPDTGAVRNAPTETVNQPDVDRGPTQEPVPTWTPQPTAVSGRGI